MPQASVNPLIPKVKKFTPKKKVQYKVGGLFDSENFMWLTTLLTIYALKDKKIAKSQIFFKKLVLLKKIFHVICT